MNFVYILLALVVLLALITVHELGHYCAGKILGFKINEFAIGFGPAIYKHKSKKTGEQFSVRLLPLGGYCAFEGEDEEGNETPGSFNKMPAWKRLVVLVSGVAFNFLFGVLTAAIYLMVGGYTVPKISSAMTASNLQTNDCIVAVNGKSIEAYRQFNDLVAGFKEDENFEVTVNRDGQILNVTTARHRYGAFYFVADTSAFAGKIFDVDGNPIDYNKFLNGMMNFEFTETTGEGGTAGTGEGIVAYFDGIYKDANQTPYERDEILKFVMEKREDGSTIISYVPSGLSMGISYSNIAQKYGFFESLGKAWPFCFYLCGLIISAFGGLFTGAVPLSETGGTITAISQIATISQQGIMYFLLLLPLLAMNLAVFNILPIPALDGAKAVFVLIEMIFRKPVPRKVEGWIHTIGLFLLLGLVVVLDINHFFFASTFLLL